MNNLVQKVEQLFNLTELECEILEIFLKENTDLTAKQVSITLKSRGENVYRPLERLVRIGLIEEIITRPKKYSIRNFNLKTENSVKSKILELNKFLDKGEDTEEFIFLGNRNQYREEGVKLMNSIHKTLDLIVSGSSQSSDFFMNHFDLIQRGVSVRCLVTKYSPDKLDMLQKWKRNGFLIKKYDLEGIDLVIYDSYITQVGVKRDSDKKEKYGFVLRNRYIAKFMQDYFNNLWEKGEEL